MGAATEEAASQATSAQARRRAARALLQERRAAQRRAEAVRYMAMHREKLEKVMQEGMNLVLKVMPPDPFSLLLERISVHTRAGIRIVGLRAWPAGPEAIACEVVISARGAEVAVHRAELPKGPVARGLAAAAAQVRARGSGAATVGSPPEPAWISTVPATPENVEKQASGAVAAQLRAVFGDAIRGVPFLAFGELHRRVRSIYGSLESVAEEQPADAKTIADLHELCARLGSILIDAAGKAVDGTALSAVRGGLSLQRLRTSPRACCRDEIILWQHQWPELVLPALRGSTQRRRLCVGLTLWAAAGLPEVSELEGAEVSEPVDISAYYARAVAASQRGIDGNGGAAADDDEDDEGALEPDQFFPPLTCLRNAAALGAAIVAKVAAESTSFPEGEDFAAALQLFRIALESTAPALAETEQGYANGGGSPSTPSKELQQSPPLYAALDLDADAAYNPAASTYKFAEHSEARTSAQMIDYCEALCEGEPLLRLLLAPISRRDPSRVASYRALRERLAIRGVVVVEDADAESASVRGAEVEIASVDEAGGHAVLADGTKAVVPEERLENIMALLAALEPQSAEGIEGSDGAERGLPEGTKVLGRARGGASLTVDDFRLGKLGELTAYLPEYPRVLDEILEYCIHEVRERQDGIRDGCFETISKVMSTYVKQSLRHHVTMCIEQFIDHIGDAPDSFKVEPAVSKPGSISLVGRAHENLCPEALWRRSLSRGLVTAEEPRPPLVLSTGRRAAVEDLAAQLVALEAKMKASEEMSSRHEVEGNASAAFAAGAHLRALQEQLEELKGDPLHGVLAHNTAVGPSSQEQEEEDRLWDLHVAPRAVGRSRGLLCGPMGLVAQYETSALPFLRNHGVYDFGAEPATLPALASFVDVSMALPEASRRFVLPRTENIEELLGILQPLETRLRGILMAAYRLDLPSEDQTIKRLTLTQFRASLLKIGFETVQEHAGLLFRLLDLRNTGSISPQDFEVFQHVRGPLGLEELDGFRLWISAWSQRRCAEMQDITVAADGGRHSPASGDAGVVGDVTSHFAEVWQLFDLPGPSGARSGAATFKQFRAALRLMRHPVASKGDGRGHELFISLDLDGKGHVKEADFFNLGVLSARFQLLRVMRVRDFLEQRFGSLKSAFKAMDKNRTEQLATDTWADMMETQQLYPDMEDVRATCQFLDVDGSHTLTPNDFYLLGRLQADSFLRELAALRDHLIETFGGLDEAYAAFERTGRGLDANSFLKGCKTCSFRGPSNYDTRLLFNFLDASHCGRLREREFVLLNRLGAAERLEQVGSVATQAIAALKDFALASSAAQRAAAGEEGSSNGMGADALSMRWLFDALRDAVQTDS